MECFRIRYRRRKNALNHLRRMKKIGLIIPRDAIAYRCENCGFWHLGHHNPRFPKDPTITRK